MTERTLAFVKCGAVSRGQAGAIVARIRADPGMRVIASKPVRMSAALCADFYEDHVGRHYYEDLRDSVTAPCGIVAMVVEGENVISRWRIMLGATDPKKAREGTIRGDFGKEMPDNAAHGSDGPEAAAREIGIIFPELDD